MKFTLKKRNAKYRKLKANHKGGTFPDEANTYLIKSKPDKYNIVQLRIAKYNSTLAGRVFSL